jgi:zinc/manganese transport system substrate-binding protein
LPTTYLNDPPITFKEPGMSRNPTFLFTRVCLLCAVITAGAVPPCPGAERRENLLVVASFHPILSDFARQAGRDRIRLIEIMKPGEDPHRYTPSPSDLRNASRASILLFSGKGLEPYLEEIRDVFPGGARWVEVGDAVPSLHVEKNSCHAKHAGACESTVDPHWWHSIGNAKRAVRTIAREFARADPGHAEDYMNAYRDYSRELDDLHRWAKKEINRIPPAERKLATPHAAFEYFCSEFGFRSVTVEGLTREHGTEPGALSEVVQTIRKESIRAVFPERYASEKFLDRIARETGAKIGKPLLAGTPSVENPRYTAMVRHNIRAIVSGLAGE